MKIEYLNEVWKDIKGYEGQYQVSNYGRVKSLSRKVWNGNCFGIKKERILKPSFHNYFHIVLYKDNVSKTFDIHRLVAQAFLPNPNNYPQVNHKDENTKNNFVWVNQDGTVDLEKSNLEWVSATYNVNYGTRNHRASDKRKKTVLQFQKDVFIKEWDSVDQIFKETEYSKHYLYSCLIGQRKTAYGYIWKYKEDAI